MARLRPGQSNQGHGARMVPLRVGPLPLDALLDTSANRQDPAQAKAAVFVARRDILPRLPVETTLSAAELAKARGFVFRRDSELSLLAHCLKRLVLARALGRPAHALRFRRNETGKPRLHPPHGPEFNLSHGGDWAALALADAPCGLDLEPVTRQQNHPFPAEQALHPLELARMAASHRPADYFLRIWTGKEALSKATGQGLALDFSSFCLDAARDGLFGLFHLLMPGSFHLSLALSGAVDSVEVHILR